MRAFKQQLFFFFFSWWEDVSDNLMMKLYKSAVAAERVRERERERSSALTDNPNVVPREVTIAKLRGFSGGSTLAPLMHTQCKPKGTRALCAGQ